MMRGIIGDSFFFGGLQTYLKDFEFGNTITDDLWNSMQSVGHYTFSIVPELGLYRYLYLYFSILMPMGEDIILRLL